MVKYLLITVLWFLTLSCTADTTKENWQGEYSYFVELGSSVGGSKMLRKYKLIITPSAKTKPCVIKVDGFQTYERILCSLHEAKDKLTIKFKSFSNGTMLSERGIEIYKKKENLISLFMKNGSLYTQWHSRDLSLSKDLNKTDIFFKKIK